MKANVAMLLKAHAENNDGGVHNIFDLFICK